MQCPVCGGTLKEENIRENIWVDDKLLVIDNLTSKVCMICNESIIDYNTMKKIEKIVEKFKHKEIFGIRFTAYEIDSMATALA